MSKLLPHEVAIMLTKCSGWPFIAIDSHTYKFVAIAVAESSLETTVTHRNSNGTTDYGLFQINSIHKQYEPSRLTGDAQYNCQAAVDIWNGAHQSFTPWSTFNNGAYLKAYPDVVKEIQQFGTTSGKSDTKFKTPFGDISSTNPLFGFLNGIDSITQITGVLTDASFWKKAGYITLGSVGIIIGVAIMFKD